jgi:hypothetical protein
LKKEEERKWKKEGSSDPLLSISNVSHSATFKIPLTKFLSFYGKIKNHFFGKNVGIILKHISILFL